MIPRMAVPMMWIASTSPVTAAAMAVVPRVKMSCGSKCLFFEETAVVGDERS